MPNIDDDDCLWIVHKAKEKFQQDQRHEAHAWILTAKSLFPFRFIVQVSGLVAPPNNSLNPL